MRGTGGRSMNGGAWDVAQSVEQRFLVPQVGGSSPPVPAMLSKKALRADAALVRHPRSYPPACRTCARTDHPNRPRRALRSPGRFGLLAFDGGRGHLRRESRAVVPARFAAVASCSFGHHADLARIFHSASQFRCSEPPRLGPAGLRRPMRRHVPRSPRSKRRRSQRGSRRRRRTAWHSPGLPMAGTTP